MFMYRTDIRMHNSQLSHAVLPHRGVLHRRQPPTSEYLLAVGVRDSREVHQALNNLVP